MANPSSRRERKKLETRQRILEVAGDLLASQGFQSTTLDQIAEGADVSRATFYNYFPNKDVLLQEIAEIEMADIGGLLAKESEHLAGPLAMIKRTMELLYPDSSPVMIVVRHLLLDAVKHDAPIPAAVLAMRNHSDFLDLVQRAQDGGELRSDLNAAAITQRMSAAYLSASIFCRSVGKGEVALSDAATRLMESAGIVAERTAGSNDDTRRPAVVTT